MKLIINKNHKKLMINNKAQTIQKYTINNNLVIINNMKK